MINLRAILTIMKDTFLESVDSWIFYIIMIFSSILGVVGLCLGMKELPTEYGITSVEISFPFLGSTPIPNMTVESLQETLMLAIANNVVGLFGLLTAIILTGSFVPRLFRPGTIELYVSRSVRRWEILVGKYLGALTFVLYHVTFFVCVVILALGLRTGIWNLKFLWTIPVLTFLFATLYSFSVLIATVWKNAIPAIFLSIALWVVCGLLGTTRGITENVSYRLKSQQEMIESNPFTLMTDAQRKEKVDAAQEWIDTVDFVNNILIAANYVFPPTGDLAKVSKAMFTGKYTEMQERRGAKVTIEGEENTDSKPRRGPPWLRNTRREMVEVDIEILRPVLTCLGFLTFCMGMSIFRFYRQEL